MFYNYLKFPDETQYAYSEIREDGTVKVVVERPIDFGFDSAACVLPSFEWLDVKGFTDGEIAQMTDFLHHNAPVIMRLAQEVSKTYA